VLPIIILILRIEFAFKFFIKLKSLYFLKTWEGLIGNNYYLNINIYEMQIYDFMHTNKLKKEQIFPSMRGCLIKLQTDEDPDEAVKVN